MTGGKITSIRTQRRQQEVSNAKSLRAIFGGTESPQPTDPAVPGSLPNNPWTCPKCQTHYAGVTIPTPWGCEHRINPPLEGDCKVCAEAEYQSFMLAQQHKENQRTSELFLKWSEIGDNYLACSFDNFEPLPGTELALQKARAYVDNFGEPDGKWLLLFGPPGNGKTHLGMALRGEIEHRHNCLALAITQPYLLQQIRASWDRKPGDDPDGRSEDWILDKLQVAKFVLLDDLMGWKEWADDRMFVLLDGRYRNQKKTVFTSNHDPGQLEKALGPRLWSRFAARTEMVRVTAGDYRISNERPDTLGE